MKKWVFGFIMLAFAIIILISTLIPVYSALVFYKGNTPEMEAFLPLDPGETFSITFTHSIHLTDVIEKYQITDDRQIKQYEIVYEEFGIGMPSNALEGETFVYKDGQYHVKNLDNYFDSINVRNGKTVSENRLGWDLKSSEATSPKEVNFNQYFEPGDWFTIKMGTLTIWEYLKGVKIDVRE